MKKPLAEEETVLQDGTIETSVVESKDNVQIVDAKCVIVYLCMVSAGDGFFEDM
jgi:hypothetical protein